MNKAGGWLSLLCYFKDCILDLQGLHNAMERTQDLELKDLNLRLGAAIS